jgi:hypothetical protein
MADPTEEFIRYYGQCESAIRGGDALQRMALATLCLNDLRKLTASTDRDVLLSRLRAELMDVSESGATAIYEELIAAYQATDFCKF